MLSKAHVCVGDNPRFPRRKIRDSVLNVLKRYGDADELIVFFNRTIQIGNLPLSAKDRGSSACPDDCRCVLFKRNHQCRCPIRPLSCLGKSFKQRFLALRLARRRDRCRITPRG